ncbi:hypothetical protein MYSTI_04039 [Myxococcus stipitatus DSM 14675]|uniref:Sulfatase-modifying factor enzyme domain-containing protein n=1 Tax=Myxococcus stipitatus (strain DSM 14675 / JCM 12634 / Mx s8) TaxID=1278073 RepID=L7UBR6_MYXSD|nr:hypothetical protein [Myxococcus stipitatus]AGC45340.1 hypothetical protein MYSTI_04039 [Myxococcus stipitatus DSM 14675]
MQQDQTHPRWLPLRDGHAVPIDGLWPHELKVAAKAVRQGPREREIQHTTTLNAVVKALGFEGGFPGYLREGVPRLERLFREQRLQKPSNFFGAPYSRHTLSREALSGRLFHSGRPMPRRVWLGVDGFDWELIVSAAQPYLPSRERWMTVSYKPLGHLISEARQDSSLAPLLLAKHMDEWTSGANFLGDVLLSPRDGSGAVLETYWQNDSSLELRTRSTRAAHAVMAVFREWIEQSPLGWVDVLPVTNTLVILRGPEGAWDFVFANLRGHAPPGRPFATSLAAEDVPNRLFQSECCADFEYARAGVWRYRETHLAEEHFYATGGKSAEYPGGAEVLRRYLVSTGDMNELPPPSPVTYPADWSAVEAAGKRLFVSPLVTIADFDTFLRLSCYRERRQVEPSLEDANGQDPSHLPVTVTWFDALAYLTWFESIRRIPVRLLRVEEYLALHPGALPSQNNRRVESGCVDFTWHDGKPLTHWRVGSDYGRLQLKARFKAELPWRQGLGGVPFLCSDSFGEWLYEHVGGEAAAINTHDLEAIIERGTSPKRSFFLADDWGAYQACKIGFRICSDVG